MNEGSNVFCFGFPYPRIGVNRMIRLYERVQELVSQTTDTTFAHFKPLTRSAELESDPPWPAYFSRSQCRFNTCVGA